MINENFVYLGLAIYICGALSYLIDTLKGKTKPNRVTFFFWAAAPLIAFAAEIKQGVGVQSLMTFIVGFNPLVILIASFVNKKAYWKLQKIDYSCGILAMLGLVLWWIIKDANIAIFFAIIADFIACIPTLVKINKFPETENNWLYIAAILNGLITLLTIQIWNFEHYAFPVYLVLSAGLIAGWIKWREISPIK